MRRHRSLRSLRKNRPLHYLSLPELHALKSRASTRRKLTIQDILDPVPSLHEINNAIRAAIKRREEQERETARAEDERRGQEQFSRQLQNHYDSLKRRGAEEALKKALRDL